MDIKTVTSRRVVCTENLVIELISIKIAMWRHLALSKLSFFPFI